MNRLASIAVIGTFAAVGTAFFAVSSGRTQTCTPLKVVGGQGTQVQKTVSPPGAGLVARNNWNTDFAVNSTASFRRYVATIFPKNKGEYKVQMSLKYNDDSVDKVYEQTVNLPQGRSFNISGSPRVNANPFQVNVFVGGIPVVGNTYTVSVSGCN